MDTVSLEIDLEEKKIGCEYSGTLSVKELDPSGQNYQKNHKRFQSTLGLRSLEDWKVYLNLSDALRLPLSEDSEAFQTCVYTDRAGQETVELAWKSSVDVVPALESSGLEESGVTDTEVLDAVDNILSKYNAKKDLPEEYLGELVAASEEGEIFHFSFKWHYVKLGFMFQY